MKKVIAVISIFCILTTQALAANFSDVGDNHTYSREIQYLKDNGISQGFSDGTYKPENQITRAELTALVIKSVFGTSFECATVEEMQTTDCQENLTLFPDVPFDNKFAPFIYKAQKEDILRGYSDGTFGISDNITFGQSSRIIISAIDDNSGISTDADLQTYIDKLSDEGALPPTIFDGNNERVVNRGEIAFLVRTVRENYDVLEPIPAPTYEFIIKRGQEISIPETGLTFRMSNHGIHCSQGYTFIDLVVNQNGVNNVIHLERSCTGFFGDSYIEGESTHEADAFGRHFVLSAVQEVVTYQADTFEYTIQFK